MQNQRGKSCTVEDCNCNAVAGGIGLCRNCWNKKIDRNIKAFLAENKQDRV